MDGLTRLTPVKRPELKANRTTMQLIRAFPRRGLLEKDRTQHSEQSLIDWKKNRLVRHASVPSKLHRYPDRESKIYQKTDVIEEGKATKLKPMAYQRLNSRILRRRPQLVPIDSLLINTLPPINKLNKSVTLTKLRFARLLQGVVPRSTEKLSWKTQAGTYDNKIRRKNQDSYMIVTELAGIKNQLLVGVLDGHGMYGYEASNYVKDHLPAALLETFPAFAKSSSEWTLDAEKVANMEDSFKAAFQKVNYDLRKSINVTLSGTTSVSCLVRGRDVICMNVGDSRSLIGRKRENLWEAVPLSIDHTPEDPRERARIILHGGRVEPLADEDRNFVGPSRIWLKTENMPGIAMSRSFGDNLVAEVGVTCDPDIHTHRLSTEDRFLLIGSDGLFQYLSNEECVNLVAQFIDLKDAEGACECLAKQATLKWQSQGREIDDITVILLIFKAFD